MRLKKKKTVTKTNKTVPITLIFDDKIAANGFVAWWLDCGGDGGGNLDWHTDYKESDDWTKRIPKHMRIVGSGKALDENGDVIDDS